MGTAGDIETWTDSKGNQWAEIGCETCDGHGKVQQSVLNEDSELYKSYSDDQRPDIKERECLTCKSSGCETRLLNPPLRR